MADPTAVPSDPVGLPVDGRARLGRGWVRHARLQPVAHAFSVPTWFVLLPMRPAPGQAPHPWHLARNRPAVAAFHDRDHGDGGSDSLAWLCGLLRQHGIHDADGAIWLHTYPRVLGVVFKPVSFWYALRADGSLAAVVAEVNNTFGERHAYVLPAPAWGREQRAAKAFHVSPFNAVSGQYRFRFLTRGNGHSPRTVVRVDLDDPQPLLTTSVGGALEMLERGSLWRAMVAVPWLSLGVLWRIHREAFVLWWKRVPVHSHPAPPVQASTRALPVTLEAPPGA